jgi:hypothetical protein
VEVVVTGNGNQLAGGEVGGVLKAKLNTSGLESDETIISS